MSRRVDEQKEEERRAHLLRRQEEAARAGRGHLDPYRRNVNRGVSDPPDDTVHMPAQAPLIPKDFGGMHVFYSAEIAEVLLRKMKAALTKMDSNGTPVVTVKNQAAKVRNTLHAYSIRVVQVAPTVEYLYSQEKFRFPALTHRLM